MIDRIYSHKPRGVALVVGLVLLFIITLVSVSNLRNIALEQRMSANAQDRLFAFQRAEQTLREGEQLLANSPGVYRNVAGLSDPTNWDGSQPSGFPLSSAAVFHIGPRVAEMRISASDPDIGSDTQKCLEIHTVHARATGQSADSVVNLRSVYGGDIVLCTGE